MYNIFKKKKKKKLNKKQQIKRLQDQMATYEDSLRQAIHDRFPQSVKDRFNLMDSLNKPLYNSQMLYNRGEIPLDESKPSKTYMGDL